MIVYLIGRLTISFAKEDRCAAYVTCPSRKNGGDGPVQVGTVSYASGQNVRLTETGPEAPGVFVHGEGEIEAWLWARVLRGWGARQVLIRSLDNDNLGLALAVPREMATGVFVELKTREYDKPTKKGPKQMCLRGTLTRRYLDCGKLACAMSVDEKLSLLVVAILGGSDFCRPDHGDGSPIPGVGIGTLLTVYESGYKKRKFLKGEAGKYEFETRAMESFVSDSIQKRRKQTPTLSEIQGLRPILDSLLWNINYWASIYDE